MIASQDLKRFTHIFIQLLVFISFAQSASSTAHNAIVHGNDTYELRLIGGRTKYEGRLEIRRNNGTWGTIFGSNWSSRYASIACRSLGFSSSVLSPYFVRSQIGDDIGPVHLEVSFCTGMETSILDCQHTGWGTHRDHASDIGLHCLPENQTLTLRLTQKTNNYTGILEVYDGVSSWGTICGGRWDFYNADVACRQLGYASATSSFTRTVESDSVAFLQIVQCGTDFKAYTSLDQCVFTSWDDYYQNCFRSFYKVAGVVCSDDPTLEVAKSEVRLWGTGDKEEGVLQIKAQNETVWRTMCFPEFSIYTDINLISFSLCPAITGYGENSVTALVDECSMTQFASNVSHVALVGLMEAVYDEAVNNHVADFLSVSALRGTCSDYGHLGVYLICSKEVHYENAVIIVTPENSCQGRCGYQLGAARCRCDPQCEMFQDCCYDYHNVCHPSLNMVNETDSSDPALFTCTPLDRDFPDLGSVMLVAECHDNWGNTFIEGSCENPISLYADPSERLHAEWPVSDKHGENFRNIYCAICNGKDLGSIVPWDVKYPSDSPFDTEPREPLESCENQEKGLGRLGKRLRFCFPSMISSCPLPLANVNKSIAQICESYSNHICSNEGGRLVMYKNYHCALCHDENVNNLTPCSNANFLGSAVLQSIWKFNMFKENSPTTHDLDQRCADKDTVYDPYTRKCRSLSCQPGYELNNRECIVAHDKTNDINGLCCHQQLSWIFVGYDKPSTSYGSDAGLNDGNLVHFLRQLNISMSWGNSSWSRNFGWNVDKYLLQSNSACNLAGTLDNVLQSLNDLPSVDQYMHIAYLFMGSNLPSTDTCAGHWFSGKAREFLPVNDVTMVTQVLLYNGQYILPKFTLHQVTYKYDHRNEEFIKEESVQVCGEILRFPTCPMITLVIEDYTVSWSENGSRIVHFGNDSYEQGEYIMYPDGRVQICADSVTKREIGFFAYFGYLALANLIGTSLSACGVTITFALHCCYRDLRNFHGRCIMILCAFLFVAQLAPTVSAYVPFLSGRPICVFMAVVSHYSWLGAFSWMSVIAFNIFDIFGRRPVLRNEIRESGPVFRYVAPAFGFGLPLFPVCISLGFQLYGADTPCWISDSVHNFWAFGVPVGIIMVVNCGLFTATVVCACRNQRRSRQLRRQEETVHTFFKDVILCLKIQITMGITWLVGFLASFFDNEALWWVFILTNSLQGVFLLIICLCSSYFQENVNKKSNRMAKNRPGSNDDHPMTDRPYVISEAPKDHVTR